MSSGLNYEEGAAMEDLGEGRGSYTCSDPKLSGAGLGEDPWRPGEWSREREGSEGVGGQYDRT